MRRSPPVYCYTALPLDLHVLSLSLAFILSQDQTLLCIYYTFCFLSYAQDAITRFLIDGRTLSPLSISCTTCLFSSFHRSLSRCRIQDPRGLLSESGCKSTASFITHQIFAQLFFEKIAVKTILIDYQIIRKQIDFLFNFFPRLG